MRFNPSRSVLAALLPVALWVSGCTAADDPGTAPNAVATAARQWLLTADPKAHALYINNVSDGAQTGSIEDIELGVHAGTIQLGNGRVAFVNESAPSLDILEIDDQGKPRIN